MAAQSLLWYRYDTKTNETLGQKFSWSVRHSTPISRDGSYKWKYSSQPPIIRNRGHKYLRTFHRKQLVDPTVPKHRIADTFQNLFFTHQRWLLRTSALDHCQSIKRTSQDHYEDDDFLRSCSIGSDIIMGVCTVQSQSSPYFSAEGWGV